MQQIYNKMPEKEINQGVATAESKSKPHLRWNAVVDFKITVHKWMPANLSEVKLRAVNDSGPKFFHNDVRHRLSHPENHYFKLLLLKVT